VSKEGNAKKKSKKERGGEKRKILGFRLAPLLWY
jgi:hypothetical protein